VGDIKEMIKKRHIGHVVRVVLPVFAGILFVIEAGGCASSSFLSADHGSERGWSGDDWSAGSGDTTVKWVPVESYSRNNPGLVFPSEDIILILAGRGEGISFYYGDGIYGRQDYLLGVNDGSYDEVALSDAVVTDDETVYESNGRSFVYGQRRVRTTQLRRSR